MAKQGPCCLWTAKVSVLARFSLVRIVSRHSVAEVSLSLSERSYICSRLSCPWFLSYDALFSRGWRPRSWTTQCEGRRSARIDVLKFDQEQSRAMSLLCQWKCCQCYRVRWIIEWPCHVALSTLYSQRRARHHQASLRFHMGYPVFSCPWPVQNFSMTKS